MIWAITHINRRTDHDHLNQYWIEAWENLRDELELDVTIIHPRHLPPDLDPLVADALLKSEQVQEVCNLFADGRVKDGDIFFFSDGWHYGVLPLSYFRKELKIDFKVIGFWADSYFADSAKRWLRMYKGSKAEHDWAKHFEKALIQTYDFNCFKSGIFASQMVRRYRNLMKYQHWVVTGYPYEYTYRNGAAVEKERKENIVVFPWIVDEKEFAIFEAMSADFPDWKFISVIQNDGNRVAYLELLRKAKIVMSVRRLDADTTILWEAMCYGCHILIPSTAHHAKYFGERYRYPIEYIREADKSHLKFLRNRLQLQDRLQQIMDHYAENSDVLEEDTRVLKEQYFTDQPFLDILEKCK